MVSARELRGSANRATMLEASPFFTERAARDGVRAFGESLAQRSPGQTRDTMDGRDLLLRRLPHAGTSAAAISFSVTIRSA